MVRDIPKCLSMLCTLKSLRPRREWAQGLSQWWQWLSPQMWPDAGKSLSAHSSPSLGKQGLTGNLLPLLNSLLTGNGVSSHTGVFLNPSFLSSSMSPTSINPISKSLSKSTPFPFQPLAPLINPYYVDFLCGLLSKSSTWFYNKSLLSEASFIPPLAWYC